MAFGAARWGHAVYTRMALGSTPSRSIYFTLRLAARKRISLAHSATETRNGLRPTPAMAAGVTNRLWKFDDLFSEVSARYL